MANEVARELRRSMTKHEVKLWFRLRELRRMGFHFRRQVPIDGYVVDFACFHPKLAIEIDGSQHSRERKPSAMQVATPIWLQADSKFSGFGITRSNETSRACSA